MRRILLTGLLIGSSFIIIQAQSLDKTVSDSTVNEGITHLDWENLLEELSESEEENEGRTEEWQSRLTELAENPIPLNTATKEMLESIPFLKEDQVEALSYYIYRYGPLLSLSELLLVEGLDEKTLRWLRPFVYLGKPTSFPVERPNLKKAIRYGKQEIRIRFGRFLQKKAGYANQSDSTLAEKSYLGDPNQLYFRYGFNYKEKMQWGIVLEKDAGEKIWNIKHKGIDYVSFHLALKDQKRLKTLILGDYNLRFGQGLVCANAFSLGKSVTGTAPEQTGATISRHFSASESGLLRGVGATFVLKPFVWHTSETKGQFGLDVTPFVSMRSLDAKIIHTSFATISSGELHRTKAESDIRDKLKMYTAGAHFSFRTDHAQIGFTGMVYGFNANWNPEWKPYNRYYFRGKQGGNYAIDYRFRYKGLVLFGEYAMDKQKRTASISGLSIKPTSRIDLSLLGRNYNRAYNAYYGNAFSEGTSLQNEYGLFASCEWRIIKNWRINAYYDVFVFPWLKYGINIPSNGTDYAIQATWICSTKSQITLRFKSKEKDKNWSNEEEAFLLVKKQMKRQIRLQISSIHGPWTLKTTLDGNSMATHSGKSTTTGFSASQDVNYKPEGIPVTLSIRYALFDANSFDNRIYSYERDLPGSFSMIPFYGQGSRFSLLINSKLSKTLNAQLKIGHSAYRDREQVGTALEEVNGNLLTDFKGLIVWKF